MTVPPPALAFCTSVTPYCPVEGTIYGYYPSIGWNGCFAGFFGLSLLVQTFLGVKYKTWTFMIAMCLGCVGEVIGYIGRILMWNNPFDEAGFQMQICCLIIAPAFVSAAIYLTLKHIILSFGEGWSRLRPEWYTWIFIGCDLLALVLQGAGGGIAATADYGSDLQDLGTNLMLAGVIWQVFCLSFFGCFLGEYLIRTYRRRNTLQSPAVELLHNTKFRLFLGAVTTAYVTILARCAYRIPELSGGWMNELMRDEAEFIALEGIMIVVAVMVLTLCHPGYCFPMLAAARSKEGIR
ncbi:sphingoid long-chain base transporter RSB1 [Lizonia empirigonia]|nr:sphingoid long-chain base transporter RSB1 [Lizonia empirigonia]